MRFRRFLLVACVGVALGCAGLGGDDWDDLPEANGSSSDASGSGSTTTTTTTTTKAKSSSSSSKTAAPAKKASVGQIDLATKAGVVLKVDGTPAVYDVTRGSYVIDVSPGDHHVEIENIAGKIVAEKQVDVPSGKRVRMRYKTGGDLSDIGIANDLVY